MKQIGQEWAKIYSKTWLLEMKEKIFAELTGDHLQTIFLTAYLQMLANEIMENSNTNKH